MTEMSPASAAHSDAQSGSSQPALATHSATESVQPGHIPAQVDHPTTPGKGLSRNGAKGEITWKFKDNIIIESPLGNIFD